MKYKSEYLVSRDETQLNSRPFVRKRNSLKPTPQGTNQQVQHVYVQKQNVQPNVLTGEHHNMTEQTVDARQEKEKENTVRETDYSTPISNLNASKGDAGTSKNRGGSDFPRKIMTRMLRNDDTQEAVT